jgi:hypothetical protein
MAPCARLLYGLSFTISSPHATITPCMPRCSASAHEPQSRVQQIENIHMM